MPEHISLYSYLCSELVSVAGRHSKTQPGNLEAIGAGNALLLTDTPLRDGAEIAIRCRACTLRGTVERCRWDAPLGYYVDVRLRPDSRWSRRRFSPEHLLAIGRTRRPRSPKVFAWEDPSGPELFLPAKTTCVRRPCVHSPVNLGRGMPRY